MSKTLVNIITEDNPIPAYLFIKEKYEVGDRLMYISANLCAGRGKSDCEVCI